MSDQVELLEQTLKISRSIIKRQEAEIDSLRAQIAASEEPTVTMQELIAPRADAQYQCSVARIVEEVATVTHQSATAIMSRSRIAELVRCRELIALIATDACGHTHTDTAAELGMDRSSVSFSYRRATKRVKRDAEFQRMERVVKARIQYGNTNQA